MNEYLHPHVAERWREQERIRAEGAHVVNDFLSLIAGEDVWDCKPIDPPIPFRRRIQLFKRDASKEGGFVLIPEGTTLPVYIQACEGKTQELKSGRSQGKMCDVYSCTLRVIGGDYHAAKILDRIWLNIQRLEGDEVDVHGGHAMWCDLCDALGLVDGDNYIMPKNPAEWANANVVGKVINVKFSEDEYEDKEGKTRQTNRIKEIFPVTKEQKAPIADAYKKLMAQISEEAAAAAAESGSGPDLGGDDDDLPF